MKQSLNSIKLVIIILFTFKSLMLSAQSNTSDDISLLQSNLHTNNYTETIMQLIEQAHKITNDSGFDSFVLNLSSDIKILKKEIITQQTTTGLRFKFLGFLLSGNFSETTIDATEVIQTNVEEFKQQSKEAQQKVLSLKNKLNNYLFNHHEQLFMAKHFTTLALLLSQNLNNEDYKLVYDSLVDAHQKVSYISFSGQVTINVCESTDYINKNESLNLGLSSFLGKINLSSVTDFFEHNKVQCNDVTTTHKLNEQDVYLSSLKIADLKLKKAYKIFSQKALQLKPEYYPTWGL